MLAVAQLEFALAGPPLGDRLIEAANRRPIATSPGSIALMSELGPGAQRNIAFSAARLPILLAEIVKQVFDCAPSLDLLVVELAMPATMRLPPALMEPRVLIAVDPRGAYEIARSRGLACALLHNGFRRFPTEHGREDLRLEWADGVLPGDFAGVVAARLAELGLAPGGAP
jgi:hypothetical protein